MNVYIHYRGTEDWEGAVIIAAPTFEESIDIFSEREGKLPTKSEQMEGVTANGKPRPLYDDYSR